MYRIRHGRKRWRTAWPWSWLYPLTVDERFCRKCGLPFHNGPLPREVKRFNVENVGALIFPAGSWGRGSQFAIRFGRWKQASRDFCFSEYIPSDELDNLIEVVDRVREFIDERTRTRSARR